ncbi:DUF6179 domain-containing protein [Fusibacter sp. 3D3]|uniref:DUF6179 domain-containing protein n=1 Tax=Fusibacter sp. 3D3 TaxID=1048380 RepID=UPI000853ABD5|nr:DUF6179 domain-containing protein [Fusibacter sp. 3D3]GAU78971.1 hypothetical protein F3D3_3607 [Fusibacter sp. 3D3]
MTHILMKKSNYTAFIPNVEKWTFSMLEYGLQKGSIDASQVEQVQIDIMKLMSDNLLRYTKGKSASVKTDVGIDLYNGVVYTIDAYFRSFNDIDDAFEKLMTFNVSSFYHEGKNYLKKKFTQLELSYKYLKSMHLGIAIDAYTDTIYPGLELFFKTYDCEYMPNITSGMIDYPLFYDPMKEIGLWYCEYYIKTLNLENDFCHHYDEHDLVLVVTLYANHYDMAPEDLINNITEILIKQSIASVSLGRAVRSLRLSHEDMLALYVLFSTHDNPESVFTDAFYKTIERLMPSEKNYFSKGFPPLLTQFRVALNSGNLSHFFTVTNATV